MLNLQYGFFQPILNLVFLLVVLVRKRRNLHLSQMIKEIMQTNKKGLD